MKEQTFNNQTAQKIYDDYFKRVRRCIAILSEDDQRELTMELKSHVYEATCNSTLEKEIDILMDVLNKLGMPEEVLQPMVADKKIRQATRTFNPRHILQALTLNITNGAGYVVLAAIYLLISTFGLLIFLKFIHPSDTGLFVSNGRFIGFGFILDRPAGNREVLGNMFVPIVIMIMIIAYLLNTLLLRLLRRK
nr:hypothetical protein [uncultured Pedobacter sp.]